LSEILFGLPQSGVLLVRIDGKGREFRPAQDSRYISNTGVTSEAGLELDPVTVEGRTNEKCVVHVVADITAVNAGRRGSSAHLMEVMLKGPCPVRA